MTPTRTAHLSLRILRHAALACLCVVAAPASRAADEWTQEGQGAGATSRNRDQSVLDAGNLDQVVKLWARDLDVWAQSTGLVAADGQAFVGRKVADQRSVVRQQLVRLDPASGAIAWQVDLAEEIATPALTPTLVIAAGDGLGGDAVTTSVRAFDRATGQAAWEYRHPGGVLFRPPHVLGDAVYLASADGDTVSLDARTGGLRWRRMHDHCCGTSGLAVADGVVVVGRSEGFVALDARDGRTLWRYDLPAFHIASVRPMIVKGRALLFDLDGNVHALDLSTGAVQWIAPTIGGKLARSDGPMATDGERVFALNGVVAPWVTALDLASGATLWSARQRRWTHSPVVSNGVLYLGTDKHLLALDPATGVPLDIARLPSMRWGELVIAEGRLFMSGGPVRAYGLSPGGSASTSAR